MVNNRLSAPIVDVEFSPSSKTPLVGADGSPQHAYFKQPEPQLPFAEDAEYWENLNEDIKLAAARDGSIPKYQS